MTRSTPRTPPPWRRRALPIGLSLWLALPLNAQAPPDLQGATTTSGLSIHQDFYEGINAAILADNLGRTAVYSGAEFLPYTDAIETEVEAIEDLFQQGFTIGMNFISGLLPAIGQIILAIVQFLIGLFCGSVEPTVELDFPQASVVGAFTVANMQLVQQSTGERFAVTVDDVGLLAELRTEVGIGTCTDESKDDLRFVYPSLTYQVDVQFTASGPVVTAQLVSALPAIDKRFDGSSDFTAGTLWGWANTTIGGADLEDKLAAFATIQVPDHLELMYTNWFVPYLARSGWLMNLSGSKQTERYAENAVFGTVGSAVYRPLLSDLTDSKVRVVFSNAHSLVAANPLAQCTDDDFAAGPMVTPNFDAEDPTAQGAFHTSYKTLEHRILAGIVSAVGLRDEHKPDSTLIVEHPMIDLVPEAGANTINWLFRNVNSPITPIPITSDQMNGLVLTPAGGGQLLKQVPLGELELKIRVCEVSRPTRAFPLAGGAGGAGVVQHEVELLVTLERGTLVVLQETLFATFEGALRLSKAAKKDSIELRTQRAELISLYNEHGVDLTQLSLSTPFAAAPVSLFLRAFLGDNSLPLAPLDTRVFYLYEGLTGPLVERAAHGMVVLPGLDFPAFDGAQFGYLPSAASYHADDYELGLDFDHYGMCATILRWGETLAMVGGSPSGTDFMLELEVAWSPVSALQLPFKTRTGVVVSAVAAPAVPLVQDNPSRHDAGFLATTYSPTIGDESRVINASGYRVGDFLPGGGEHYVAATALAYRSLREGMPASLYPDTTIELRPYRRAILPPCSTLFPGPIHDPPHVGSHHEDTNYDVYEALTFETRKDCLGVGGCDGARVVALWTAPLFHDCPGPSGPFGVDFHTFDTTEGTIRVPPSGYAFHLEYCQVIVDPGHGEHD